MDVRCNQIQQQEYDFQQHDMALRDEINSLSRTIKGYETSSPKKLEKSKKAENGQSHPLDINDSGIDSDELEKSLNFEKDKNEKLKIENGQKNSAIKELENIVRSLRADNEDLVNK